ncbi:MAG: hypothetical protein IPJ06_00605 [Saprospiraceae bacterium]|nr:hypothetical protein [Saprospiraceae bacterium]
MNAIKIVKEMVYPSLSDSQLWLQDFEEKFNAVVSTDGDTIMDMRYTSFKEGFKAKIDARKGPTDSIDFAERTQLELELQELRDTLETYRFK